MEFLLHEFSASEFDLFSLWDQSHPVVSDQRSSNDLLLSRPVHLSRLYVEQTFNDRDHLHDPRLHVECAQRISISDTNPTDFIRARSPRH